MTTSIVVTQCHLTYLTVDTRNAFKAVFDHPSYPPTQQHISSSKFHRSYMDQEMDIVDHTVDSSPCLFFYIKNVQLSIYVYDNRQEPEYYYVNVGMCAKALHRI